MRRFRFIGDPKEYDWSKKPVLGEIYDYDKFVEKHGSKNIWTYQTFINNISINPDWQEVFEDKSTLHKDTDLGYFAGLAMQGMMSDVFKNYGHHSAEKQSVVKLSIDFAKELIKQLNEHK